MKKTLLLIALALYAISCRTEEKLLVAKQIQFAFANISKKGNAESGRVVTEGNPQSVIVTLRDNDGNIAAEHKALTLYKFGDSFLSLPLTLKTSGSNYYLSEFFVVGADNTVIYATPKEGSAMAYLVADPLDIGFTVTTDKITTITPEVIAVDSNSNPADYGYGQFGFNVINSIKAVFSSFIKRLNNFELTTAHLKIEGLAINSSSDTTAVWIYETELEAKANIISLKEAAIYRVTSTKDHYELWRKSIVLQNGSKTEILLEKSERLADIYVAGEENTIATFWKNGIPFKLGTAISNAGDIFVLKNDVYVTGVDQSHSAFYWKNGEKVTLSAGDHLSPSTGGIFVSGDDVYVGGRWEGGVGQKQPIYWKNGNMVELPTDAVYTQGETNQITVSGPDVYISGNVFYVDIKTFVMYSRPAIWKNSKLMILPVLDGYTLGFAYAVKISNGAVYVGGTIGGSGLEKAVYWKNSELNSLGSGSEKSSAKALFVLEDDVYISGRSGSFGNESATYWKNGEAINVASGRFAELTTISVIDEVVYAMGHYQANATDLVTANIWVNGKRTQNSINQSHIYSGQIVPRY